MVPLKLQEWEEMTKSGVIQYYNSRFFSKPDTAFLIAERRAEQRKKKIFKLFKTKLQLNKFVTAKNKNKELRAFITNKV
jgi:hypothetical protein